MLRFAANLSMLFTEAPFLDRFAIAYAHELGATQLNCLAGIAPAGALKPRA